MTGRAAIAIVAIVLASCRPAVSTVRCAIPGDLLHWQADYCLLETSTDDIIAADPCLERESARRFRNECAAKHHYKRELCARMIAAGHRDGSVAACVADPAFMGATVRNDGA